MLKNADVPGEALERCREYLCLLARLHLEIDASDSLHGSVRLFKPGNVDGWFHEIRF